MLERRVSNNRADLTGDQRMNYFLSWFQGWSDLQKTDFVAVLAHKMSDRGGSANISDMHMENVNNCNVNTANGDTAKKPPSLYECQIKLFQDWFSSWSDDQKNYLVTRLQAIDADFYEKYAAAEAKAPPVKDYFEPGVPPELVRKSSRSVLGPHAATFNAHQILPADQPKSFIHTGSSTNLHNGSPSSTGGSGDSLESNNSSSEEAPGGTLCGEGGQFDRLTLEDQGSEVDHGSPPIDLPPKKHHSTSNYPENSANLSTIAENVCL